MHRKTAKDRPFHNFFCASILMSRIAYFATSMTESHGKLLYRHQFIENCDF